MIQRVRPARVVVDGRTVGEIDAGLLVLRCAERGDAEVQVTGQFAADMQVHLVNDGRVTIPLPAWGLIVLHTSRDSPRRATHFLLRRQEKVSKEKATRLSGSFRFAPGSLRCSTPAGVGRTRFAQTTAALIPPPSALLGPAKRAWGTRTNSGRQGQGRAKAHPCRSQKGG